MARSIWNGSIALGALVVPIKVHSAVEDKGVHFSQVHEKDGAQIEHRRICPKEGKQVPYSQIVKGYETGSGEYVVLEKDEIAAAAGERSRVIEIEEFVPAEQIDPVFYDRTYYVGAGKEGQDAYRLLHDALAKTERVGLGRWVFHNREYLVGVRALEEALGLYTMRFHDELVAAKDLDIRTPSRKPKPAEVRMAAQIVESLHAEFDPEQFEDSYRERVLELIEAKAAGKTIEVAEPEPDEEPADLMAALKASLESGKKKKVAA